MLRLETERNTDIGRIAKALAVGVAVAVPMVMFVAPAIVRYERSTISTGDTVGINYSKAPGYPCSDCVVETVHSDGTVTVVPKKQKDVKYTVPYNALFEL